jgi:hypothetical protein
MHGTDRIRKANFFFEGSYLNQVRKIRDEFAELYIKSEILDHMLDLENHPNDLMTLLPIEIRAIAEELTKMAQQLH